ncbi:hypothetical protein BG000_007818 [Podila horticola]|nr:hypothetical protein BG000_007818 [Podila horticola]
MACDLSGISVFDAESNIWQGQFGFSEGGMSGLVEASIPCTQFSSNELEYGMLRRLVLQTYHADDMLQILSLMDCSPALQKIDTPAQGNVVFTRIARDWDLILGGIHYSILKILRVSGSNIPGIKKYKAVLGSQFQQLKGRVRGSLRMAQHDRGQGRSSKECATQ